MNTFEVLQRHGTLALMRFAGTIGLFLALHLLRIPFVLIGAGLAGVSVALLTHALFGQWLFYTWLVFGFVTWPGLAAVWFLAQVALTTGFPSDDDGEEVA